MRIAQPARYRDGSPLPLENENAPAACQFSKWRLLNRHPWNALMEPAGRPGEEKRLERRKWISCVKFTASTSFEEEKFVARDEKRVKRFSLRFCLRQFQSFWAVMRPHQSLSLRCEQLRLLLGRNEFSSYQGNNTFVHVLNNGRLIFIEIVLLKFLKFSLEYGKIEFRSKELFIRFQSKKATSYSHEKYIFFSNICV